MYRWLSAVGFWLIGACAGAEDPVPPWITVTPSLCITDARTDACDLRLEIRWEAVAIDLHCVRGQGDETTLQCWTAALDGETAVRRVISEPLEIRLEAGQDATVVAATLVDVLSKDVGDRRRRRRTRYVWDVL